jgi:hypothetical protein
VAFWVVFIIGGDIARGLDDAVEAARETRHAPKARCMERA